MRPVLSRHVPGIGALVVAVAACLAVATAVEAQTPPATPRAGDAHPPMQPGGPMMDHREHGGPGMHMMRDVERLKTSLALTAQQSALWDRAVASMKPQGDMREQMRARRDRMASMLDDPNFDPRRLAAEMDRGDAERKTTMTSMRDAWFAVYDALNPVQRGQVREFLRERMSHGHRGMRGGPDGGWMHHGDGRGPMPPNAPPAPPAPTR